MADKIELYVPTKIKVINLILYSGALLFGVWLTITIFNKFNFDGNPQPDLGWLSFSITTGLIIVVSSIWYLLQTIKSFNSDQPAIVIDDDGIQLNNTTINMPAIHWDEIKNIRLASQKLNLSPPILIEVSDLDKLRSGSNQFHKQNFMEDCIVMQTTFLSVDKNGLLEELKKRLDQTRQNS